jgi:hypothetical protein
MTKKISSLTLVLLFASILLSALGCVAVGGIMIVDHVIYRKSLDMYKGTWTNSDYDQVNTKIAKIKNKGKHKFSKFKSNSDKKASTIGRYYMMETWEDDEKNLWYKAKIFNINDISLIPGIRRETFELGKLNETGTILEIVWSPEDYPDTLDPEDARYGVYYRDTELIDQH